MNTVTRAILVLTLVSCAYAADDVVSAVHGTVQSIDAATRVIVVKAADGTMYTLHLVKDTAVHGANATAMAAKGSWKGLKAGSEIVAHYTKRGTEDTAVELDRVGEEGLKVTKGTITAMDRGGKTMVVKTADGTEQTFKLSDHAAKDAGKGIAEGTEKGSEVVVYSTEDAGKKIAHFFEKV